MPGLECEPLYEVLDRVPCKLKLSTALYVWHPEPQRKSGRLRVYSPEGSAMPSVVPYKTLSKDYKALSLIHPDATRYEAAKPNIPNVPPLLDIPCRREFKHHPLHRFSTTNILPSD
jgi:hypothetical protein